MQKYEERARNESYAIINQAYRLYDALWVLALALNHTDALIKAGDFAKITECGNATGSLVSLEKFNYSNELVGCLIQWSIQQTDFYGLSVSYSEEFSHAPIIHESGGSVYSLGMHGL